MRDVDQSDFLSLSSELENSIYYLDILLANAPFHGGLGREVERLGRQLKVALTDLYADAYRAGGSSSWPMVCMSWRGEAINGQVEAALQAIEDTSPPDLVGAMKALTAALDTADALKAEMPDLHDQYYAAIDGKSFSGGSVPPAILRLVGERVCKMYDRRQVAATAGR